MDPAETTWLVTAVTGIVAALSPVALRLLATATEREHDQEIAEKSLQLRLRDELRRTISDLRDERTVLRDELREYRTKLDDVRTRYEACEAARLELMEKVERLERQCANLQERTTRLEDKDRRNGGDNLGMAGGVGDA